MNKKIDTNSNINTNLYTVLLIFFSTLIIGFLSLACTNYPLFNWPLQYPFYVSNWVLPFLFLTTFAILGEGVCLMWTLKSKHRETKKSNLVLHFVCIVMLATWPMLLLLIRSPIVAICVLCLTTLLMIYMTYRFLSSSIWAGSMYAICTAFLIALVALNFWWIF